MSRHGYSYDLDDRELQCYRNAVDAAICGKRGQKFLRDLAAALDSMPDKRLIAGVLESEDGVCAIGCLGRVRHLDMSRIDIEDPAQVGRAFGIARALAAEIEWINDGSDADGYCGRALTPETRFEVVRAWVQRKLSASRRLDAAQKMK